LPFAKKKLFSPTRVYLNIKQGIKRKGIKIKFFNSYFSKKIQKQKQVKE